jgi:hypothetical protein
MLFTREDPFIKLFLSAYQDGSWADADVKKPDAIDRTNPAVDLLATRKSDSRTSPSNTPSSNRSSATRRILRLLRRRF